METVLAAHAHNAFKILVLFCTTGSGYGALASSAALAVLGLLVLASGILVARSGARRAAEGNGSDRIKSRYAIILLLIIAGCFLTTFGVAFVLTFTLAC